MLRIRLDTEDWRDECGDLIDQAVKAAGVTRDHVNTMDVEWFDPWVEMVTERVTWRLEDLEIEWARSWRQSVGTFHIVQGGTDAERAAFRAAFDHVAAQPEIVAGFTAGAGGLKEYHEEGERLAQEEARQLTRADVAHANDSMDAALADLKRIGADEWATDNRLRSIWMPIAESLRRHDPPAHREEEAQSLGADYVGALPTGELVIWDGEDSRQVFHSAVRRFQILDTTE